METRPVIAGEELPELDLKKHKIKDTSKILNFSSTKKTFHSACTGTFTYSSKESKSKPKKGEKSEKAKMQVDCLPSQSLSNYYYPKQGDMVIGKIIQKYAFSYDVDINAYSLAVLDALEFDGATKRNKPNLELNTLIYCRVKAIDPLAKPELTCISPIHKKSWTSGESYFGPLKEGFLCEVPTRVREYLQTKN